MKEEKIAKRNKYSHLKKIVVKFSESYRIVRNTYPPPPPLSLEPGCRCLGGAGVWVLVVDLVDGVVGEHGGLRTDPSAGQAPVGAQGQATDPAGGPFFMVLREQKQEEIAGPPPLDDRGSSLQ